MIVVTRPSPYGEELTQFCQNAGLTTLYRPFFKIKLNKDILNLQTELDRLKDNDIVIVTSPQITHMLKMQSNNLIFPDNLNYYAVGEQSAYLFQQITQQPVKFAIQAENSEGLLALIDKKYTLTSKPTILILAGNVNRPLLKETFIAREWSVKYLTCYTRETIHYNKLLPTTPQQNLTFIITSVEHLMQLDHYSNEINKTNNNLIVSHQRIKNQAESLGWRKIYLTNSANNQILFKTIATLCHNG